MDTVRDGLAQSRRVGNRWEMAFLGQIYPFFATGEWDEALAMVAELPIDEWDQAREAFSGVPFLQVTVGAHRGTLEEARSIVERLKTMGASADVQELSSYRCAQARLQLTDGDHGQALDTAERALSGSVDVGFAAEAVKEAFVVACEAARALGDDAKLTELLSGMEALPAGRRTRFLDAQILRFRARLAGAEDLLEAERGFSEAAALFREVGMPFYLAVVQLEHAEVLASSVGKRSAGRSWPRRARPSSSCGQRLGSSASTRSASAPERPPDVRHGSRFRSAAASLSPARSRAGGSPRRAPRAGVR